MENEESRQGEAIRMRLAQVRQRIANAAQKAGRSASDIEIVAVSKGQPAGVVRAASLAGLSCFGENYVQEAVAKKDELEDLPGLFWHFIGHLQSNKASLVTGRFALIQSIDSERLARKVSEAASRAQFKQAALVQVHLGEEATKFGVSPEDALALCEK